MTIQQFKVLVDSLVGSDGGGGNEGNTGGFSNFIPVDDLGVEAIDARMGSKNPAILCIQDNAYKDLLIVHIPGYGDPQLGMNSPNTIEWWETSVFLNMNYYIVDIGTTRAGVQIKDHDSGDIICFLYLGNKTLQKHSLFDDYCTAYIMFLDGYYS